MPIRDAIWSEAFGPQPAFPQQALMQKTGRDPERLAPLGP
jgi:hypothetical protein